MITEADEAATSKETALANYCYMKVQYYMGLESMGVADMYALACIEMGLQKEVDEIDHELASRWRKP